MDKSMLKRLADAQQEYMVSFTAIRKSRGRNTIPGRF